MSTIPTVDHTPDAIGTDPVLDSTSDPLAPATAGDVEDTGPLHEPPADVDIDNEPLLAVDVAPATSHLRLSSLTLSGFKSFADRTEFRFDEPVCGIVGPNGCGKSNVVDAIKWVLGERSSKSLRGKEMIDVIFAGSAGRAPSGLASVTLAFENPVIDDAITDALIEQADNAAPQIDAGNAPSDDADSDTTELVESEAATVISRRIRRALPVDAEIVEVERRLYRDGKSQYLINGRLARLKDIRELFMDTGIGADAYSIIEQGKVDRMLLSSPQDRRLIFEEAAGIAKYKQRRIEAQRKLERAEANLSSTRQKLESTERRLRIVRGQAGKARKFQALDSEYKALRVGVAFHEYHELCARLEGLTSQMAGLEDDRATATRELDQAELAKQDADLERSAIAEHVAGLDKERLSAEHERRSAEQRRTMASAALADTKRRVEVDRARHTQAVDRHTLLERELGTQRERVTALSAQVEAAEGTLAEASEHRAALLEQANTSRQQLGELRRAHADMDRERTQLQAQADGEHKRVETLQEQADRHASRQAELEANVQEQHASLAAAADAVAEYDRTILSLRESIDTLDERAANLTGERGELAARLAAFDEDVVRLDTRRATLDEMVRDRVGLAEPARHALEQRDAGTGFRGIMGVLADMLETDAKHAASVEAALGSNLHALVTRTRADLPTGEELAALPGRARFLPALIATEAHDAADVVTDFDPALRAASESGRCTRLRELVCASADAPDEVTALLDRLLGQTFIVPDLESAMLLSASGITGPNARFVTRDGSVLEADASVVAGPAGSEDGTGLLARRAELHTLITELADARSRADAARTELEHLDRDAASVNAERTEHSAQLANTERARVQSQNTADRAQGELDRLGRDRDRLDREATETSERIERLTTHASELIERVGSLTRLIADAKADLLEREQAHQEGEAALEAANEQLTVARVELTARNESHTGASREAARTELELDQAARARDEHASQAERAEADIAQHETAIAEATETHASAEAREAELASKVNTERDKLVSIENRVRDAADRVRGARQQASHVERDWQSVELARRELEVRRESAEERANDDLGLNLSGELPEYRELMSDADIIPIDIAAAEPEIADLKKAIRALGNVNLDAIDEEQNLEEQNDELIAQVADIDDARSRLTEVIRTLNEASRARFGDAFERIREHFGSPNGMFRQLFGGGQAEVRLMPLVKEIDGQKVVTNEVDLLESGIEIVARPPGKQPRSISQLSGGEKTLTSVALLLSIFRSKPSCFCVLDEVDAALDEHNVGRYNDVVRRFTDLSRFIVITHNKRTMQSCDSLTGVTMQERGVSTRIRVKLDQVAEDGSVTTKASVPSAKPSKTKADTKAKIEPKTRPAKPMAGITPTDANPSEPASARPSDALRAALGSMRNDHPVEVEPTDHARV